MTDSIKYLSLERNPPPLSYASQSRKVSLVMACSAACPAGLERTTENATEWVLRDPVPKTRVTLGVPASW
jgi:hypothetical protein